jgi:hypothetical protein
MSDPKEDAAMLHAIFAPDRWAPVTVAHLALVTGLSDETIRRDIQCGELRAVRRTARHRSRYAVPVEEARRYLQQLGIRPPVSRGTP